MRWMEEVLDEGVVNIGPGSHLVSVTQWSQAFPQLEPVCSTHHVIVLILNNIVVDERKSNMSQKFLRTVGG
jgi:hypothetical protein